MENTALTGWSDEYSVHLSEIDEQHKQIFELILKVYDEVVKPSGKLKQLIAELVDYTIYHFRLEEEMLLRSKYPDFEEHKRIHDILIRRVREFQLRIAADERGIGMELLQFLQKWLVEHILEEDRSYTPFIDKAFNKQSWWKKLFS